MNACRSLAEKGKEMTGQGKVHYSPSACLDERGSIRGEKRWTDEGIAWLDKLFPLLQSLQEKRVVGILGQPSYGFLVATGQSEKRTKSEVQSTLSYLNATSGFS